MSNVWVYVNQPTNKALVHLNTRAHCNYGKGRENKNPHSMVSGMYDQLTTSDHRLVICQLESPK